MPSNAGKGNAQCAVRLITIPVRTYRLHRLRRQLDDRTPFLDWEQADSRRAQLSLKVEDAMNSFQTEDSLQSCIHSFFARLAADLERSCKDKEPVRWSIARAEDTQRYNGSLGAGIVWEDIATSGGPWVEGALEARVLASCLICISQSLWAKIRFGNYCSRCRGFSTL